MNYLLTFINIALCFVLTRELIKASYKGREVLTPFLTRLEEIRKNILELKDDMEDTRCIELARRLGLLQEYLAHLLQTYGESDGNRDSE